MLVESELGRGEDVVREIILLVGAEVVVDMDMDMIEVKNVEIATSKVERVLGV